MPILNQERVGKIRHNAQRYALHQLLIRRIFVGIRSKYHTFIISATTKATPKTRTQLLANKTSRLACNEHAFKTPHKNTLGNCYKYFTNCNFNSSTIIHRTCNILILNNKLIVFGVNLCKSIHLHIIPTTGTTVN